jgi:hypothetical protein
MARVLVQLASIAFLATLGTAVACDDSTGPGDGTSTVSVLLTDDPDDLVHAWIEISEIYLQGGDADGRLVLFEGLSDPIDLLTLIDDFEELVETDVPQGEYGQLRLVLEGAAIETEGGEIFATEGFVIPGGGEVDGDLQCPSCTTAGIHVLLQGRDLTFEDLLETLILDFDVSDSFAHPAGQSGMWVLSPVIKLFDDPAETDDD